MKNRSVLFALIALTSPISGSAADWPNWRGPNQDGSTQASQLPAEFSKEQNVRWSAVVPGSSASCPVVSGGRVFLTAPVAEEEKLVGLCYDAKTGKELWRATIAHGLRWDDKSNMANPSPTCDGERVVFLFSNAKMATFDYDGKLLWERDFTESHGAFATQWTYGSSPLLDGGKLYLQVLQRNEVFDFQGFTKGTAGKDTSSYILAVDPATGKDLWKVVRPTEAVSESQEAFSSPVVTTHDGKRVLLITGGDCITGHDAETGLELWRWGTWNEERIPHWRLVPSAVAGDGIVLACAPKKNPVYAFKLGGSGTAEVAWVSDAKEVSSDVSTPLFYDGRFYVLDSDRKALACVEPKSGEVIWRGELPSRAKLEASPTAADGKIYCVNFWGEVFVVKAGGDEFQLLHTADMGDGSKPGGNDASVRATIAIADDCLFIRTQDKLYCVGQK
ncbi:MAG: PQQ-binding-like beta-propeller repeat protein [Verrucomicrobiales bacterium]|nr:PQQ-binding-like beta-propeller repeat protein [Verrucomicrobiales bacterium]